MQPTNWGGRSGGPARLQSTRPLSSPCLSGLSSSIRRPHVGTPLKRILVTGGAGFVGASLSVALARMESDFEVTALDNLRRRGSELNLARLREAGVRFVHGDVRQLNDLMACKSHDVLVECSAEPSVLAGFGHGGYVVESNLIGAYHCLELARRDRCQVIFLSTSRVYPLVQLNVIRIVETNERFEIAPHQDLPGVSPAGISESFPMEGARTLYGATKLSAELLIEEYRDGHGITATVDRCGVIAGPWQMGRVDQGVFTHWLLSHYFDRPLSYIGYGGSGKQVRDLLHVDDLVRLVIKQITRPDLWDGVVVNVGGGRKGSLSLRETTAICQDLTGNGPPIGSELESRPGDVPIYISDCSAARAISEWQPLRSPSDILEDIFGWARTHEAELKSTLGYT